jgi:hypothetical protein
MADANVIVKSGEVTQTKRILSVRERASLEQSRMAHAHILGANGQFQSALDGPAPVLPPDLRVNRGRLNEQQRQIEKTLAECSPEPIADKDRDAYVRRAKQLEEIFRPMLETREELHVLKRDKPAWQSATVKANARISGKDPKTGKRVDYEGAIAEWKSIQIRLKPDDEDADSLHQLRKERD